MKKRALSLLLAFVMALGLAVPAFAAPEAPDMAEVPEVQEDVGLEAPEAPLPEEPAEPAPEAQAPAEDEPVEEKAKPIAIDEPAPAVEKAAATSKESLNQFAGTESDPYLVGNDVATLNEAFKQISKQDAVYVRLEDNIVGNATTVSIGSGAGTKKIVFDLNNHTITFTDGYLHVQGGNVTITSGTSTVSSTSTSSPLVWVSGGTCRLEGGNYTGGKWTVYVTGGAVTLDNATVKSANVPNNSNGGGVGLQVNSGSCTVQGNSSITGQSRGAVCGGSSTGGELTINGGTFTGESEYTAKTGAVKPVGVSLVNASSIVNITGGENVFDGDQGIAAALGKVIVSGGTVTGGKNVTKTIIASKKDTNTGTIIVEGTGTVKNNGTSSTIQVNAGGTLELKGNGSIVAADTRALDARTVSVAAVEVVCDNQTKQNPGKFTMTGGTITADTVAVTVNGGESGLSQELFTMSNGNIQKTTGGTAQPLVIIANGTMKMTGGTITTQNAQAVQIGAPKTESEVENRPLSGKLNMTGGTITATGENSFGVWTVDGTANSSGGTQVTIGNGATITSDYAGLSVNTGVTADVSGNVTGKTVGLNVAGTANVTGGKVTGNYGAVVGGGGKLTVSGGEVHGDGMGACTNGSETATDTTSITVSGSGKVTGGLAGVYLPSCSLTVSDSAEISGQAGVVLRGGTMTVTGGTIKGTDTGDVTVGDAGHPVPAAAITVDNAGYGNYKSAKCVTISGDDTKLIGAAEGRVLVFVKDGKATVPTADVNPFSISGGKYSHSVLWFVLNNEGNTAQYELYTPSTGGDTPYTYPATGELEDLRTQAKNANGTLTVINNGKVGDVYKYYKVTTSANGGTITLGTENVVNDNTVFAGDPVSFTVKEDDGYELVKVTESYQDIVKGPQTVTLEAAEGSYKIEKMPCADVTVNAVFVEAAAEEDYTPVVDTPKMDIDKDSIPGNVPTEVKENIYSINVDTAPAAKDLYNAAQEAVKKANVDVEDVKGELSVEEDKDIYVHVLTTIETKVEGYNQEAKTLTLSITPYVQFVASTQKNPDDIDWESSNKNAVLLNDGKKEKIHTEMNVDITVPIPEAFTAQTELYIKHTKDDGKEYWYTGKVNQAAQTVTFNNPHGFSEFEIGPTKGFVASIGEVGYTTLQDAVDAALNAADGTITLENNGELGSATVTRTGRFKVDVNNRTELNVEKLRELIKNGGYNVNISDLGSGIIEVTVTSTSSGGGGGTTAVDKSKLKAAIAAAEALKKDDYTEESWSALQTALAAAKTVDGNAGATQEQVNSALSALTAAQSGLVKKGEEQEPGPGGDEPGGDIPAPPKSGTGWSYDYDTGDWYFYKNNKLVANYWVGKIDGASQWDNNWYYVGPDGKMLTGMQYLDDLHGGYGWYFLQPTNDNQEIGKMLTGWQWVGGDYGECWFSTKSGSEGKCTWSEKLGDWNGATWSK